MHHKVRSHEQKRAEHQVRRAGYQGGGDVAQDKALVKKAIREHENQEHGGRHAKLKLKAGGRVHGKSPAGRMDKAARGGHRGHKVTNVIVNTGASHAEKQMAAQKGLQVGAALGARAAAARMTGTGRPPAPAPMAPPVGGGPRPPMPMAGPGPGAMPPQGPMRRGGAVKRATGGAVRMTAGAGSGEGRIEKERMVKVKAHTRRARGGKV